MLLSIIVAILILTVGVSWIFSNEVFSQIGNCDPSYPQLCISPSSPDLNCPDIPEKDFRVLTPDPHGFDLDSDGIGCESS